jgi:hypothetical protein
MHPRRYVAKLRKAARGKHRWLGLLLVDSISSREELEKILESIELLDGGWRLFDFIDNKAILRIPLPIFSTVRPLFEEGFQGVKSVTSSGKIRLVRERMDIVVKRQKR